MKRLLISVYVEDDEITLCRNTGVAMYEALGAAEAARAILRLEVLRSFRESSIENGNGDPLL